MNRAAFVFFLLLGLLLLFLVIWAEYQFCRGGCP
jgi:hypothetical protein